MQYSITTFLELLRVRQWYKNLVVFAAAFFTTKIIDTVNWPVLIAGFFILSFVSSAMYIHNDLVDFYKDQKHRKKSERPIASRRVKKKEAVLALFILLIISFGLTITYAAHMLYHLILLVVLMSSYNIYLKKIAYVDILIVATNFLIRALAGAAIIFVPATSWFYAGLFSVGLFLVIGKRFSDLKLLGTKAMEHKEVYSIYGRDSLHALLKLSLALMLIIYSLYVFEARVLEPSIAMLSLPIVIFISFRYYHLIIDGDRRGCEPIRLILDGQIITGVVITSALLTLSVYLRYFEGLL